MWFTTITTFHGSFFAMNYLLLFKGWTLGKSLPILILFIRLFSGMAFLMSNKNWASSSYGLSHSHYISRVYFHYESSDVQQRMYTWKIFHIYYSYRVSLLYASLMINKSWALPKGFSAFIIPAWFLISMAFLMFQHSCVIPESFPTFITYKRPFSTIYSLMMSKGCLLSKDFLTVFTFVRVSDWSEFSDDLKG